MVGGFSYIYGVGTAWVIGSDGHEYRICFSGYRVPHPGKSIAMPLLPINNNHWTEMDGSPLKPKLVK